MDERLKFVARLLDGEKMAGLCRQFGISRKTGYKIVTRYNEISLGRQDSNLGMAESKSTWFALFVNAHSEKWWGFDLNPLNTLVDTSECRDGRSVAPSPPAN
jgi:hypothetical protein